ALLLLARQGRSRERRVAAAVRYLEMQSATDDLEHLCWIKLALQAHADQPGVADLLPRLDDAIVKAQASRAEVNWVRPAPLRQALTALALAAGHRNVFQLPDSVGANGAEVVPAAMVNGKKRSLGQRFGAWFRG